MRDKNLEYVGECACVIRIAYTIIQRIRALVHAAGDCARAYTRAENARNLRENGRMLKNEGKDAPKLLRLRRDREFTAANTNWALEKAGMTFL